jgi:protease-4
MGRSSGPIWGDRIAVLEIDGVISDDVRYLEQIQSFRRDNSVKGFLVVINSPGGVVGPSQSIYRELRRLRDDDVPVVATIGAVGASGGYYVALGADSIYALPGSLTGSIGVIMEIPQVEELLDRIGVDVEVVKSAEFKDTGSPFRPMGPQDRDVLQGLVQDVYSQFVDVVAEERRLPFEEAHRLADGRVYSGRQALEAGLVDQIGNMNDALAAAGRMAGLGDEPRTVWPQPKRKITLLDLILGQGAAASLARAIRPLEQVAGPRLQFIVPF